MDMKKLNPWNWFKHEEKNQDNKAVVPVKQGEHQQAKQPLSDMMQLHTEIDRLFQNAFRGFPAFGRPSAWGQMMNNDFMSAFEANVNVASDDKQYTVTLEAPGLEQKDIAIELKNQTLFIKGNKQQEKEEKDKHYYRVERQYGSFERVLAIPDDGDVEGISAAMKNGVLTVNIPRKDTPASDVKKISIDA
ncbi:MAG TPA: Hsp20/alpha crystallin family protein [Gammaproteobacteria bacterium]|nr:Hsp20/alpha crystallin family protein [Gammaproteobacteria bacterium]